MRITTKGICQNCDEKITKRSMLKHLSGCSSHLFSSKKDIVYHLRISCLGAKFFWLHLEMNGTSKLRDLDNLLRNEWLECCGHLSSFEINGENYESHSDDYFDRKDMDVNVNKIFYEGLKFTHLYDFGDTTHLLIEVLDKNSNSSTKSIKLLSRNEIPSFRCMQCESDTDYYCSECLWGGEPAILCTNCFKKHEHKMEDTAYILSNSPRTMQCGYDESYQ